MSEQQNALKRTADPRVYAVNVRLNESQFKYTSDQSKYTHCQKFHDFSWEEIDRPMVPGHTEISAACSNWQWFPINTDVSAASDGAVLENQNPQ
jgi:hypothetical protein